MMRRQFPRARGAGDGRGPQIGPGTIDLRSTKSSTRPVPFGAIVYSEGATLPDVEYWCFRNATPQPFEMICEPDLVHNLWLDLVPEEEQFSPPQNPFSGDLIAALKAYSVARLEAKHAIETADSDWKVRVARPYQCSPITLSERRKFEAGFYEVRQVDLGPSQPPTAWVWVVRDREFWLHHLPDEVDGFAFVGRDRPGTSQVYASSRLAFVNLTEAMNALDPQPSYLNIGTSLATLKTFAMSRPYSPVQSTDDIDVHDYRVTADN